MAWTVRPLRSHCGVVACCPEVGLVRLVPVFSQDPLVLSGNGLKTEYNYVIRGLLLLNVRASSQCYCPT